jgi:hypothetical protein
MLTVRVSLWHRSKCTRNLLIALRPELAMRVWPLCQIVIAHISDSAGLNCYKRHCSHRKYATLLSQEDADGLITEGHEPVGVISADCLPALIA